MPADILVGMATSVIAAQREMLAEQQSRIEALERALKVAASSWRPANAVIH